jgi:hypothetical protein
MNEEQRIAHVVQELLDRNEYEERELTRTVAVDRIYQDHGYWYVPVATPHEAANTFNYYGYLADVEEELDQSGHKVVIVPCLEREVAHREGG